MNLAISPSKRSPSSMTYPSLLRYEENLGTIYMRMLKENWKSKTDHVRSENCFLIGVYLHY